MPAFILIIVGAGLLVAACIFVPEMLAARRRAQWSKDWQHQCQELERLFPFSGVEAAGGYL